MNPHIELVKKFLADNDSVSLEELEANIYDAYDVWLATDYNCDAEYAAFKATRAAYWAAFWTNGVRAAVGDPVDAKRWKKLAIKAIAEYARLTK